MKGHSNVVLRRRPPALVSSLEVAVIALLASGCGGHSTGVAKIASSTTTATSVATGPLAYTHCMRAHGITSFPEPDNTGGIPKSDVIAARDNDPSRFDAANTACEHLVPNGLGPPQQQISAADQVDYLKAAACMRRHGFPSFPDPTFPSGRVNFNVPANINQHSLLATRAVSTCRKQIPAGLPYSGTDHP